MRRIYFYFSVFLTIAITAGSLLSLEGTPLPSPKISDKLVHIIGYFLLALSWKMTYNRSLRSRKLSTLIGTLVLFYGIIIEALQHSIGNNRQFDAKDIFANFIGICIAFILFSVVFRKKPVN